jgi:hypothetical protein
MMEGGFEYSIWDMQDVGMFYENDVSNVGFLTFVTFNFNV